MDIKQLVKQYLSDEMLMGAGAQTLGDDDSFLERNLLDSTGVLELVDFLEDRCGVQIADSEIVPANLDTLARIQAFIQRKGGRDVQAA
jgi:acyl carrier protein